MRRRLLTPSGSASLVALSLGALLTAAPLGALADPALMPAPRARPWTAGTLKLDRRPSRSSAAAAMPCAGPDRGALPARRRQPDRHGHGRSSGSRPAHPLRRRASEAYRLAVTADGVALEADGSLGVLRGLATLRQLIEVNPPSAALPFVTIDDAPASSGAA